MPMSLSIHIHVHVANLPIQKINNESHFAKFTAHQSYQV